MRTRTFVVAAAMAAVTAVPFSAQSPIDPNINDKIRKEEADNSQVMKTLHYLADVYGPRVTGSPNHKAAAEWAVKTMTSWGMVNGKLEPWAWNKPGWANEHLAVHAIAPFKDALVVEALAWTPQGDALAYSTGGEQPGLWLWAIGAEGDIKPLPGTAVSQLRWSLDGQQLATDTAIYSRTGQLLNDTSNDPPATLIDWGPQGLFYSTSAGGSDRDLWLWDNTLPQQIDSKLTTTQSAGVVLVRP